MRLYKTAVKESANTCHSSWNRVMELRELPCWRPDSVQPPSRTRCSRCCGDLNERGALAHRLLTSLAGRRDL